MFPNLNQKSQILERSLKNVALFVKKANIMSMTSSKLRNICCVKSKFLNVKQYKC